MLRSSFAFAWWRLQTIARTFSSDLEIVSLLHRDEFLCLKLELVKKLRFKLNQDTIPISASHLMTSFCFSFLAKSVMDIPLESNRLKSASRL